MTIADTSVPSGAPKDVSDDEAVLDDDVAWLFEILGEELVGPNQTYLGRPSRDELRLLLPTHPRAAAGAALRRADNNRSLSTVAAGRVGRVLAAMGLLSLAPGTRLSLARFSLVEHLATTLGEPKLVAAVTIGQRRRNRKPVLQLIRPDGMVVGYAKVGWSPLTNELVSNEADILRLVEGRLGTGLRVPHVLCREPWGNGQVVVTSPLLPQSPIGAAVSSVTDRRVVPDSNDIVRAIAAVEKGGRCPVDSLDLWQRWERYEIDKLIDLHDLRRRHEGTMLDIGLWHGDFTPWNLLVQGSSVAIWDWEFAGVGRPIGFDALHRDFEEHRRAPGGRNQEALIAAVERSAGTLRSLGVGDDPAERDAIVDLYLCELLARECQLDGQRWSGGAMAELAPEVIALLKHRSAS